MKCACDPKFEKVATIPRKVKKISVFSVSTEKSTLQVCTTGVHSGKRLRAPPPDQTARETWWYIRIYTAIQQRRESRAKIRYPAVSCYQVCVHTSTTTVLHRRGSLCGGCAPFVGRYSYNRSPEACHVACLHMQQQRVRSHSPRVM